jgi:hypothetical protein
MSKDIKNVYKDVLKVLTQGLKSSSASNLKFGGWDEVKETIDDETFKIPIYEYQELEIGHFQDVVRSHPCFLKSVLATFNGEQCILAEFLFIDPSTSTIQRKKSTSIINKNKEPSSWSWTFLFTILIIAVLLASLKEKFKFPF